MESQWLLWKINGCYESHLLLWKVVVAMQVNGCFAKSHVAILVTGRCKKVNSYHGKAHWLLWKITDVFGCHAKSIVTM
jgi:hypothetical protein